MPKTYSDCVSMSVDDFFRLVSQGDWTHETSCQASNDVSGSVAVLSRCGNITIEYCEEYRIVANKKCSYVELPNDVNRLDTLITIWQAAKSSKYAKRVDVICCNGQKMEPNCIICGLPDAFKSFSVVLAIPAKSKTNSGDWADQIDQLGPFAPVDQLRRLLDHAPQEAKETQDYAYFSGICDYREAIEPENDATGVIRCVIHR